ncbi:MAG TPA: zf-HC2 domain-containing protein, partial [Candidatus Binatia bacterium]|nr:zf-HC2 domain-containing protein [Candidatus Binatia bacterium]
MNCEEVSKHLTEYLDKTLDTAMTTRVATHVISCALCRAESTELADCVRQVASLPEIDPPLGFAQRVMAHVRDIEPTPSLWQRLMLSLASRAPVRATALAVVAIGAIALYQKEQPLKQNSDVNLALRSTAQTQVKENESEPTATSATPAAAPKDHAIDAMKTASVPAQVAKASDMATSPRAGSSLPAQSPQVTAPSPLRSEKENSGEATIVAPKRPPLRVQEVTTARDNDSVFGETRGFGVPFPASLGASRQPALRPAPMALERAVPLGDRIADFEFIVRRRSPQRRDQVQNLSSADALQKSNETENTSPATSLPSTPPAAARAKIESIAEFRFYNVAPEHFEIFKKELALEATIESEPKATAKEIEAARQADRQLL